MNLQLDALEHDIFTGACSHLGCSAATALIYFRRDEIPDEHMCTGSDLGYFQKKMKKTLDVNLWGQVQTLISS